MRKKRVITDEGIYHVYQQANSRVIIFYDDEERAMFLSAVSRSAKIFGAAIYAYVIMDNHWHILVKVTDLAGFVTNYMISYVKWYNRKRRKTGNLCNGPFSSSPKSTFNKIADCIVYILNNPVKSYMVKNPFDYKWSSVNQYFNPEINSNSCLPIDTSVVNALISNRHEFERFLINPGGELDDFKEEKDINIAVKYSDLSEKLIIVLNGRFIYDLQKEEIAALILQFSAETKATYIQLANLFHVSYTFVRDVIHHR